MHDDFSLFVVVVSLAVVAVAAGVVENKSGYKQGQIDAINGIIKYELRKDDDGEMKWAEKD